jgi:hypothetical protein
MSFDWSHYLALADELARSSQLQAPPEARQRASISRSYYAAFCSARNYLRDVDGDPDIPTTGIAHEYVRVTYQKSPELARKQIANWLDRLWQRRRLADYRDIVSGLQSTTTLSLVEAARVLENLARQPGP